MKPPTGMTDFLGQHISDMKYREQEQRDLSDEHRLRAETIMGERIKLENAIYAEKQRDQEERKHLESLLS